MYRKYMHVERISGAYNSEIDGLLDGEVYVFPKLDGANHSVYWDAKKEIPRCGSRNQILSEGYDTTGFYKYFAAHPELARFVEDHKNCILYGEFLIPHTIRTYVDEAWNQYYVFDIVEYNDDEFSVRYVPYEECVAMLEPYGIKVIPSMDKIQNPDIGILEQYLEKNDYLMQSGNIGEGIVVKNYNYRNIHGRSIWGKLVREAFKVATKSPNKGVSPEDTMAFENVSKEFVSKEYHKFMTGKDEWSDKMIPDFLKYIWQEWWVDYSFELVAQSKRPVDINGLRKAVSKLCTRYVKQVN